LLRINNSLLVKYEDRILNFVVGRLPRFVTPDILTFLGFLCSFFSFVFYLLAKSFRFLLIVNSLLIIFHWFFDNLDGRLARYRKIERDRYGLFVDHSLDAFSSFLFLFGLGFSGLVKSEIWFVVSGLVLVLMSETYLYAASRGVFKLSFGKFSGTEARFLFSFVNLLIFWSLKIEIFSVKILLSDSIGLVFCGLVLITCVIEFFSSAFELDLLDKNLKN